MRDSRPRGRPLLRDQLGGSEQARALVSVAMISREERRERREVPLLPFPTLMSRKPARSSIAWMVRVFSR